MKLDQFESVIRGLYEQLQKSQKMYNAGVDVGPYDEGYYKIIKQLLVGFYGEEGYDWITWYCYENEFGQKGLQAVDADKNLICYDVQSLYNYLNEHYMSTNTMTNEATDMISLYDFLGYPAGSILGTEVWKASFQEGVTTGTRHVETSRYKGPIVLYPKQFLIKYFKNKR